MVMNEIHNPFEVLHNELLDLNKKVDRILRNIGKVDLYDEFNVEGLTKAAKILNMSEKTLANKLKKGDIMKENIHFRLSVSGRYMFSQGALLKIKGLI